MGITGSATSVINYDNARGFLLGEENQGLNAMFTMMNYERLSVGLQGLGSGIWPISKRLNMRRIVYREDHLEALKMRMEWLILCWSTLTCAECCYPASLQ